MCTWGSSIHYEAVKPEAQRLPDERAYSFLFEKEVLAVRAGQDLPGFGDVAEFDAADLVAEAAR